MAKISHVDFGEHATTIDAPASLAIDGLTVQLLETQG